MLVDEYVLVHEKYKIPNLSYDHSNFFQTMAY